MRTDIVSGTINMLKGDATILSLLGGANVYRAMRAAPPTIPCVTVKLGSDSATSEPNYSSSLRTWHDAMITIHVWCGTAGEDADAIEARVDALMPKVKSILAGVNYKGKIGGNQQQFEEDRNLWHNTARYGLTYAMIE